MRSHAFVPVPEMQSGEYVGHWFTRGKEKTFNGEGLSMFGNDIPPQKFDDKSVGRIVVGFYAVLVLCVLGGAFTAGFLLGRWTG